MKFKDTFYGDLTNKKHYNSLKIKNKNLSSLEGCPLFTHNFDCSDNNLETLKYSPEYILGDFNCSNNKLKSLKSNLKEIGGNFDCRNNSDLKNIKKQIIENQIEAEKYTTDDGVFTFGDIKEEFENYQIKLEKIEKLNKMKLNKQRLNNQDYGYVF